MPSVRCSTFNRHVKICALSGVRYTMYGFRYVTLYSSAISSVRYTYRRKQGIVYTTLVRSSTAAQTLHTRFGHLLTAALPTHSLTCLHPYLHRACYTDPFHCRSLHRARSSTIPGPGRANPRVLINHKRRIFPSALVTMMSVA